MAKKKRFKLKVKYVGQKTKFISAVKIRKAARPLLRALKREAGTDSRVLVMAGGHKVIDK